MEVFFESGGAPCALAFFLGAIFRSLEYEGDLLIVLYIFGTVFALWSFVIGEETAKKN